MSIESSESMANVYRPWDFKDIVGQDHVVHICKGMIEKRKVPKSILFEGETGNGKTTTALVMATYVNCKTNNACGKCESCKLMKAGSHPDVHILNMGTDGKVDQVRKMIKSASNRPMFNKRIFILDECHLLTGASAKALLVPMESGPKDTLWFLCTTNPEKMEKPMIGRCSQLTMKPIESSVIAKRLYQIAKKEGTDFKKVQKGKQVLEFIASITGGHMREAIALLEKVLFAKAGGADISDKTVLQSYTQGSEANLDMEAAKILAAIFSDDLSSLLRFIVDTKNARGIVSKMRFCIDFVIKDQTNAKTKFKPYVMVNFYKLLKKVKSKHELSLPTLLRIQQALLEVEYKFNSSSISEEILLQSALGNLLVDKVLLFKE